MKSGFQCSLFLLMLPLYALVLAVRESRLRNYNFLEMKSGWILSNFILGIIYVQRMSPILIDEV